MIASLVDACRASEQVNVRAVLSKATSPLPQNASLNKFLSSSMQLMMNQATAGAALAYCLMPGCQNAELSACWEQMIEELLGRAESCEWDCRGELTAGSNTTSEDVAEELLQHANCGGRKVSSRWEDGQAPVLVSGAGHDSLPMSEITKVIPEDLPRLG